MIWLRAGLLLWATIALVGPVSAASRAPSAPFEPAVRLAHSAIGCAARETLEGIAVLLHEHGNEALKSNDCRRYETFSGKVVDETEASICVLGRGGDRCVWFQRSAFAPAKR